MLSDLHEFKKLEEVFLKLDQFYPNITKKNKLDVSNVNKLTLEYVNPRIELITTWSRPLAECFQKVSDLTMKVIQKKINFYRVNYRSL